MSKVKICKNARKNIELANQDYSPIEIKEIVQAQFHYFWYNINLGYPLTSCAYDKWEKKQLDKIKKEVMIFKRKNVHIFKNQLKLFNTVMLHLSLVKEINSEKRISKI